MEKTYKILKMVLLALVFAAVLLGAKRLYDTLGAQVQMDTLGTQATQLAEESGTEPAKQPAPDFTVYDMDGNPHKLSDFFGKPIVLNFWASWCGPCQKEMPDFEKKYKENGDKVTFLMVNLTDGSYDTVAKASKFISDNGYTFPVFYDTSSDGADTYKVYSIPTTFFIGADGQLVAQATGAISASTLQQGIDLIK